MQNQFPHKPNGLPIMRMADINDFAIRILQEYLPNSLEAPMAFDIQKFAEDQLFLDIKESPMFADWLLGLIVVKDVRIPIDSQRNCIEVNEGTILLNSVLNDNLHRKRFTTAHEVSHWILHRGFIDKTGKQYEFRNMSCSYVARENDIREYGKKNPIICKTDEDWAEWQADYLGAALLMPGPTFVKVAGELMDKYQFPCHILVSGKRPAEEGTVVRELSEIYQVSCRSIKLRLRSLGMYLGVS